MAQANTKLEQALNTQEKAMIAHANRRVFTSRNHTLEIRDNLIFQHAYLTSRRSSTFLPEE